MQPLRSVFAVIACALAGLSSGQAAAQSLEPISALEARTALAHHTGGRVVVQGEVTIHQWPGTYFEAAFTGTDVYFAIGSGDQQLRVFADGRAVDTLVRPAPGLFRLGGLSQGDHRVRIEVLSESQAAPNAFDGFFLSQGSRPLEISSRSRQIEFIGDSHTVGFGNASATRDCTRGDVWARTDTSRSFGPMLGHRYDADYRLVAISGRGVVRNYNGRPGLTLPQAYPNVLLGGGVAAPGEGWSPGVLVVALGTNDFSTPLNPGEPWPDRGALQDDFFERYVAFLRALRTANPDAALVVWASDVPGGEMPEQVRRVVSHLQAAGDAKLAYVPVKDLSMSGCAWHPSLSDDQKIADALAQTIDRLSASWMVAAPAPSVSR